MNVGSPWAEILSVLLAFVIGGIPFGWIAARVLRGVDLRTVGSGNIGATNFSRLYPGNISIVAFAGVFILDFAKGFCAAWFAVKLGDWLGSSAPGMTLEVLCGSGAILGHVFSPYLGFNGGKGVATALGAVTALTPWASVVALGTWGLLVGLTRYMSLGSIGAVVAIPIYFVVAYGSEAFEGRLAIFLFFVGLAAIVIWRHRGNIRAILEGKERKVGAVDQKL